MASVDTSAKSQRSELPSDRANFHMERAKKILLIGSASSLELERATREIFRAFAFVPDDAAYFMTLAKVFRLAIDVSAAINCYRYVLSIDTENRPAKKFLTELLNVKGKEFMLSASDSRTKSDIEFKMREARAIFEESLSLIKDVVEIQLLKTVCHIQCGELNDALETIDRVVKMASTNKKFPPEAYVLRAKIRWARGLVEEGNADIRVAAALAPEHPEVVAYTQRSYAKAEMLYKTAVKEFTDGHLDDALNHVQHALFITSEDVKLHIMIAKILRLQGRLQEAYVSICNASNVFNKINKSADNRACPVALPAEITRQTNLVLNEIALNFGLEGDYEKAILLYNRIIKEEIALVANDTGTFAVKMDFNYYLNRGDCYRAQDKLREAIEDYSLALEVVDVETNMHINNRLSMSYYLLAVKAYNKSDFPQAEAELDGAIYYNRNVAEYFALRGQAMYYNSNFQEACADFRRTIELQPDNHDIREKLSQFESSGASLNASSGSKDIAIFTKNSSNLGFRGLTVEHELKERRTADSMYQQKVVSQVRVSSQDMVQMMLHPNEAKKLPTLKMLDHTLFPSDKYDIKQYKNKEKKSMRRTDDAAATTSTEKIAWSYHTGLTILPDVTREGGKSLTGRLFNTPNYSSSLEAARDVKAKTASLHMVQSKKLDTSKGELWTLVNTAKELVFDRAHPHGYATGPTEVPKKKKKEVQVEKKKKVVSRKGNNILDLIRMAKLNADMGKAAKPTPQQAQEQEQESSNQSTD